ncbi:hypothetical protein [Microcystis aeruginosa]|uniref:hypothetical protein n=1 Tax=Microcystis aeruginosa TaxID=1126 RepID=UPI00123115BA|nr:hypothetical protein [Microcystis aeruginosa]
MSVLNRQCLNRRISDKETLIQEVEAWEQQRNQSWFFGLCYVMDGGYKRWNPYRERHWTIFVNCF